ncbi:MAG: helix-turn-helix domain-containing protein [Caulobacter sp.]|nr:helix-turn-helix domain-containing protein [Caulobacter sp.]
MSLEARNWARRIGGLSIAAKAVLMALADHADAEGKAWPKLKTLAEITSMTERHVRRQIGVLEERGLLAREDRFRRDGGQTSNIYRLAIERPAPGREGTDTSEPPKGPPPKDPPGRGRGTTKAAQGTPPEPSSSDKEERADTEVPNARAAFDQVFDAWKTVSPARLSRPRALPLWLRLARRFSPTRLHAAALRYLREDPDVRRYGSPQGLANWLRDEKFEAWMSAPEQAAPAARSSVPTALAEAAAQRKGVAWTASWLAPCRYDARLRILHARTAFAAKTIATELGGLLREFGIGLAPVLAS